MTPRPLTLLIAFCLVALAACSPHSGTHTARWRNPRGASSAASPSPSARPTPTHRPATTAKRTGPKGSLRTTGSKGVALTFDDGPSPIWTPRVLRLLRQSHVKATFCLVGTEVRRHPDLVRAIVRDGHTLCNHSWDHDMRLGSHSSRYIRANLARTNSAIRTAVPGARIDYFRQPGGLWTSREIAVVNGMKLVPLHWSVDPQDWRKPPASTIVRNLVHYTTSGAVVLMHDGGGNRRGTYYALRKVLPYLKRRFHLISL